MGKNRSVCKFENNEQSYNDVLDYLIRTLNSNGNVKYHTFRISRWYAQSGRCAVLGTGLSSYNFHCHHKVPKELGGTDEYSNLIIIHEYVHHLIHAVSDDAINKYLKLIAPIDKKQMDKINKLRKLAGNPAI